MLLQAVFPHYRCHLIIYACIRFAHLFATLVSLFLLQHSCRVESRLLLRKPACFYSFPLLASACAHKFSSKMRALWFIEFSPKAASRHADGQGYFISRLFLLASSLAITTSIKKPMTALLKRKPDILLNFSLYLTTAPHSLVIKSRAKACCLRYNKAYYKRHAFHRACQQNVSDTMSYADVTMPLREILATSIFAMIDTSSCHHCRQDTHISAPRDARWYILGWL